MFLNLIILLLHKIKLYKTKVPSQSQNLKSKIFQMILIVKITIVQKISLLVKQITMAPFELNIAHKLSVSMSIIYFTSSKIT